MNRNHIGHSMTETELRKALNGNTIVLGYDDLAKYRSIDQILRPHGNAIILYKFGPREGHWVGVLNTIDESGNPVIEVFDPYGTSVDRQFDQKCMLQFPRYLSQLLLKSPIPVHYNHLPFQTKSPTITTCGSHVAARIMNQHLSLQEYKDYLDSFREAYDNIVVKVVNVYYP